MSCNCKNTASIDHLLETDGINSLPKGEMIFKYTLKVMAFLMLVILLPILNLYIIWIIFNVLVLNKSLDIMPLLMKIGNKFKDNNDDDDEIFMGDDYDNITEDDVILLDTVDITNEVNNN